MNMSSDFYKFIFLKMKKILLGTLSAITIALFTAIPALADSLSINFESPTYILGNINGQDGWTKTGPFDSEVVSNSYGYSTFDDQTLRISNAVTSGSFGDQTFAKPLVDSVGEIDATAGSFSAGTKKSRFEMQFDIASAVPTAQQTGMSLSVSPDRGDGSRMSYLSFTDNTAGIDVTFYDVQGTTNPANFVPTVVATGLNRAVTHNIKLVMDVVDGPSNDVVTVYINGSLVHTGTSWENYYRFDSEASAEQSPRIVKTVIFRAGGTAFPANSGNGFLFDNLSLKSGPTGPVLVGPPTTFAQCKNNGWRIFNNPTFKNKEKCENYVKKNQKTITGNDVVYTAYGLKRDVDIDMSTGKNGGTFEYDDAAKGWYNTKVTSVKVDGNFVYFAGRVVKASNPSWINLWVFGKIENGTPDKIWGSFTDETTALAGVESMSTPADGPFNVTKKDIKIK
jgi:hypothetical protein